MDVLNYRKSAKSLRQTNREVLQADLADPVFLEQLRLMEEVLRRDGVGLAAPQVGWNIQLFLLCIDEQENAIPAKCFINPKIVATSKVRDKFQEGCLSFPGLYLDVIRPTSIVWTYQDLNWQTHQIESTGFYARAVQHETDHCQGRVFIDLATSVQKLKVNRWLKS